MYWCTKYVWNFKINWNEFTLKSHKYTHTHLTKYIDCWNSYKCNIYKYIKYNVILKRRECFIKNITAIWTLPSMYTIMYLQTVCFTECFINTSQQYGCSPVRTPLCTFRLYALLNVLLTHHSNMDARTPLCTFRLCFTECFIDTSQQYGRSPVCTPLCTSRLYALLNVL